MQTWSRGFLLGLLIFSFTGCQGFRAQMGGGIGLGADIKIPGLCHTGLSAGQFMNIGIRYDDPELSNDIELNALAYHWSGRYSRGPEYPRRLIHEHDCFGWAPEATTRSDKEDALSAWDFEIGVMALVLDIRLGFGPARFNRPPKHSEEESPRPRSAPSVPATPALERAPAPTPTDAPEPEVDPLAPR